ncbi:CAP domain-containing protein [Adlercreutzia agrestimuris]|uniref:CAP domain-containing protein n=1 Tax=Adlercreutzia agrestimuris TaxID=2941324 RepID=UPI003B84813A
MKKDRTDSLCSFWKRSLSVVLAGVLCVSMVPASAFASDTEEGCVAQVASIDNSKVEPQASSVVIDESNAGIAVQATTAVMNALVVSGVKNYTDAYEVLKLVNIERAKEGLKPLVMDKTLLEAAMTRAVEQMYCFDHTRPDGSSWSTVTDKAAAENIAMGQPTPASVMQSWMNSAGHRASIMNPNYTTLGVGAISLEGSSTLWWVQLFGTEKNPTAAAQPANQSFTKRCAVATDKLVNANFQFRSAYYTVEVGKKVQAEARFINSGWDRMVCELDPATFTWSMSDPAIASVNAQGIITGKKAGKTKVWAAIPNTPVKFSLDVTVTAPPQSGNNGSSTNKPGSSASTKPSTPAKVTGSWKQSSGRWWYSYSNGTYAKGWKQISGTWYYFNTSGWMLTGWQKLGGSWYYLKSSGAMATGWQKVGSSWYYLRSSGAMATGWIQVGGTWYYLNSSGSMLTGWQKIGGAWYYLRSSGAMATGWLQLSGKWYYLYSSGAMAFNRWVGNYYFDGSGVMVTSRWVGNYYVGPDGRWIPNYGSSASNSGSQTDQSIVYWTPNGSVYHNSKGCPALSRSKVIQSGTIAQSGKSRACKDCS